MTISVLEGGNLRLSVKNIIYPFRKLGITFFYKNITKKFEVESYSIKFKPPNTPENTKNFHRLIPFSIETPQEVEKGVLKMCKWF